ncbi:MAG: hypothetical protein RLZZ169_1453 [Pseudomonadota bacterium]
MRALLLFVRPGSACTAASRCAGAACRRWCFGAALALLLPSASIAQVASEVVTAPTVAAPYGGDPISLNFQDIEVRALLQILADFNEFNLLVGDAVQGSMSVRLDDVPWDQALAMVLRARGLDQRLEGSVLYVGTAEEIAEGERLALERRQQVTALEPLVTDFLTVHYAQASDLVGLLQAGDGQTGGILTQRGRASVDTRTNTLIVQDIAPALSEVRALVQRLDVPVRQVLIEARIVNASTSFSEALGVRWSGARRWQGPDQQFVLGGTPRRSTQAPGDRNAPVAADSNTTSAAAASDALTAAPEYLMVDLGLQAPASLALGYAAGSALLELELAALEASGNGEVIAQPKITTQDQQSANITSGVQIPYQSQAGGTAGGTTTQFVTAALSLQVTPQITPEGRIIMALELHQDSVVPGSGTVPAIATNAVATRVLVNDGDTIVLGGVFREEVLTSISKTPILGDLPYLGNLFKRREEATAKTELLIFITPSVINDPG